MRRIATLVVLLAWSSACGQSLFNNAVKGGLKGEGLITGERPGGGWYSELFPGNAGAGASFRQTTFTLADDFEITSEKWRVREVTVWGFQDNLHYPSVDRGYAEIRKDSWIGHCVGAGVWLRSEMTEIYRIFTGKPSDMYHCQRVTYAFDAVLGPGRYWLVFGAMGVINVNGPWSPFLTPKDSPTVPGANAMVRVTGPSMFWRQLRDPGDFFAPLDLPFWIDGERLPVKSGPGTKVGP